VEVQVRTKYGAAGFEERVVVPPSVLERAVDRAAEMVDRHLFTKSFSLRRDLKEASTYIVRLSRQRVLAVDVHPAETRYLPKNMRNGTDAEHGEKRQAHGS
jgi:hypothetical protein